MSREKPQKLQKLVRRSKKIATRKENDAHHPIHLVTIMILVPIFCLVLRLNSGFWPTYTNMIVPFFFFRGK